MYEKSLTKRNILKYERCLFSNGRESQGTSTPIPSFYRWGPEREHVYLVATAGLEVGLSKPHDFKA